MWDVGPSSGRLCSTQGAEGMCWKSCCHQSLPKSFPCSRDTLSGGQQSLCSPLRAPLSLFGMFFASAHFSPGLHLCSFYGVQCFSSLLPFPLLGTFKPLQSPWLLVLEHALRFLLHTPAPNDPSTSSLPKSFMPSPKPLPGSLQTLHIPSCPVYFSPLPLV